MAKPTEQRKGNTTKANPTPQQSAAPNLFNALTSARPATLGACRASIRVRNDSGRLAPGLALTSSGCPKLVHKAATSRSAANAPPKRRTGHRRATLAPKHRSVPPIPQITPTQSRINCKYSPFVFNRLADRPQGIPRSTCYPKSDKTNDDSIATESRGQPFHGPGGTQKPENLSQTLKYSH